MTSPSATSTAARESVPQTIPPDDRQQGRALADIPQARWTHAVHSERRVFCTGQGSGQGFSPFLETDVFTTAKLRLPDKLKEFKKPKATVGTFAEARLLYETDLDNDYTLADGSRQYRKARIAALLKSWPGLDAMKLETISETPCRAWAKEFSGKFDGQNFNNTLGSLRAIVERGGIGRDANPAFKIKRLGVKPNVLFLQTRRGELPEIRMTSSSLTGISRRSFSMEPNALFPWRGSLQKSKFKPP